MSYVPGWVDLFVTSQTSGASEAALAVRRDANHAVLDLHFAPAAAAMALSELRSAVNERGMLGTYEGLATFQKSIAFLATLPADGLQPHVSVDPDGEIAFDWITELDVLSVSLGASGRLTYAQDFAGETVAGSAFFGNSLPAPVAAAISRFY